jgi:hypothetical protein
MPQIINFLQYLIKARYFAEHPEAKFASVRDNGTLEPPAGAEFGSLYFTLMHFFTRDEAWHVRVNWILCVISGIAAVAVGILVHGMEVSSF